MDTPHTSGMTGHSGKRNASSLCGEGDSTQTTPAGSASKKRKPLSVSNYLYDVLFLQGDNSDITIRALEREWHLHKVLLSRSEYFSSMFSGAWKEANESVIELIVPDDITPEALDIALGSLYKDNLVVTGENVVQILSAASFLQIDSLVMRCIEVMKSYLSFSTVCSYLSAAAVFDLTEVTDSCLAFMEWSIDLCMHEIATNTNNNSSMQDSFRRFLKDVSIDFMEMILGRPNLLVRNEESFFTIIIHFIRYKSLPCQRLEGTDPSLLKIDVDASLEYFRSFDTAFIESEEGKPFAKLLKLLKVKQLHELKSSEQGLWKPLMEAFFPRECLQQAGDEQWTHMIRVNRGLDHGPRKVSTSEEGFAENCVRCALIHDNGKSRNILHDVLQFDISDTKCLGYNFGIGLMLIIAPNIRGNVSVYLQAKKHLGIKRPDNPTILCRQQVVLLNKDMTAHGRYVGEITEIDLGTSSRQKVLEFPFDVATSKQLQYIFAGIQVQFVNPL